MALTHHSIKIYTFISLCNQLENSKRLEIYVCLGYKFKEFKKEMNFVIFVRT